MDPRKYNNSETYVMARLTSNFMNIPANNPKLINAAVQLEREAAQAGNGLLTAAPLLAMQEDVTKNISKLMTSKDNIDTAKQHLNTLNTCSKKIADYQKLTDTCKKNYDSILLDMTKFKEELKTSKEKNPTKILEKFDALRTRVSDYRKSTEALKPTYEHLEAELKKTEEAVARSIKTLAATTPSLSPRSEME